MSDTLETIWAMQPEGVVGGDIFPMRDVFGYNQAMDTGLLDVDYLDALEAAQDEEEFRMKGVTDGPTLGEAEEAFKAAAENLASWQAMKGAAYGQGSTQEGDQADQYFTRQAELQAELQNARNTYVALGGDPDPSFLSRLGQGAIDLIGAGGQAFSDIISGGTGPEVAQTLLDPISILTGGAGATINYGDAGKTTPLIVGNTTATGMPVGLNIPDPRAITDEGLLDWIINNAGLGVPAAAAVAGGNTLDTTKKTGDGVGLSGASLIAAAEALDKNNDAVKTITGAEDIIGGTVDSASPAIKTGARDIVTGGVDSDIPVIKTGARDIVTGGVDSDSPVIKTGPISDAGLDEILTDIGGRPAVAGGYDTPAPEIKTSSAEQVSSGDSGGGGDTSQQSGVRTVSGGPGPLVDIDYLYDFKDSLLQPFRVTDDEDEIEGRQVKRFSGADDSYVLADGASYGPTNTRGKLSQFVGDNAGALLTSAVGGLFGLLDNDEQQPSGYQGAIPDYQFNRTLKENAFSAVNPDGSTRRPGSMGRSYFDYGAVPFTGTGVMQGVGIPAAVATDTGGIADLDTSAFTSTGTTPTATTPAATTPAATTPAATTPAVTTDTTTTDTAGGIPTGIIGDGVANNTVTDENFGEIVNTTDSNAAFNSFIAPFSNQVDGLTPAQLIALGDSGYDLSTIASTLKVDPTALSNAIAQATSAAQTQSVFDAVDPADGFSDTEAASIANLILGGQIDIEGVANQFEGVSDMDVIEGMLRGGYESPAAMTERLASYNTDFTEVELMASLLRQGRTTPEELAAYYSSNPDYPEYAAVTADDVREFAKGLGIEGYAQGGNVNGYYLGGTTDGMADQIPATIDNMQPAALSDGEFVIPADVVSHLGNGNSDAGAQNLYSMMERIRTDRTGNPNQGKQINPNQYLA